MVKRKDGLWQEVLVINGKRKYFYSKTKAEVLRKIREYQEAEKLGVTFSAVAEDWQRLHREEIGAKTWLNYKPHYDDIVGKHGEKSVGEITALDVIADLKLCVAQKRSATIISTRRSLYRMILDHALINGHINYNPATGISMPKGVVRNTREAPDEDVFTTIMKNTSLPFGLFPALLACTGMRKSEALALTWGDIGKNEITVNKSLDYVVHAHPVVKTPKTKAGFRTVPIIDVLKPLLSRPQNASDEDLLFPSSSENKRKHMTQRQYGWAWDKYCAAAGLVDDDGKSTITAHQLRHCLATMGFEAGVDELTMQRLLGHASPTTTRQIYTHLREKKMMESIAALNQSVSKKCKNDVEIG